MTSADVGLSGQALQRVMLGMRQLPSPPEICLAISQAAQDDATTLADIQQLVESDPALAGRLLQVANCAFLGVRERVTSVRQAIVLLGFQTVRSLALGFFLQEEFGRLRLPGLPYPDLPRYAIATSVVCDAIAQVECPDLAAVAATVGLLHECGTVVMATAFGRKYRQQLAALPSPPPPLEVVERRSFGIDHATAGSLLLRSWRLPEPAVLAIAQHHGDRAPETADRQAARLWSILRTGSTASLLFFAPQRQPVTAEALRLVQRHFRWAARELADAVRAAADLYRARGAIFSTSAGLIDQDYARVVAGVEELRATNGCTATGCLAPDAMAERQVKPG